MQPTALLGSMSRCLGPQHGTAWQAAHLLAQAVPGS